MIRSGRIRSALRTSARQADDVRLQQAQFGRVLDRDDALAGRDATGEDVEQRGLAAARPAGNQDVDLRARHAGEQFRHFRHQRVELQQLVHRQARLPEPPDRQHRPVQRQWRHDGVHPRAVRQARVDHRARLVDAPADARDDLVDDLHEVRVVAEADVGQLDLAVALHVHLLRVVHQDVRDARVEQQRLQRAEAEHLALDVAHQAAALEFVDDEAFLLEQPLDHPAQFLAQPLGRQVLHRFEVDALEQQFVQVVLQVLVGAIGPGAGAQHGRVAGAVGAGRFESFPE
jgi:hypothetical protein